MLKSIALASTLSLLAACGGEHHHHTGMTTDTATWDTSTSVTSDGGTWLVSYTSDPDPIPLTDNFSLSLFIEQTEDAAAVTGAAIEAEVTMPAHNHGMNTEPSISEVGDGEYTIDGMQFHMSGHWQIDLTITVGDVTESAIFHTECCQ